MLVTKQLIAHARAHGFLSSDWRKIFSEQMTFRYLICGTGESSNVCLCMCLAKVSVTQSNNEKEIFTSRVTQYWIYQNEKAICNEIWNRSDEILVGRTVIKWNDSVFVCVAVYIFEYDGVLNGWHSTEDESKLNPSMKWINNDVPCTYLHRTISKQII